MCALNSESTDGARVTSRTRKMVRVDYFRVIQRGLALVFIYFTCGGLPTLGNGERRVRRERHKTATGTRLVGTARKEDEDGFSRLRGFLQ